MVNLAISFPVAGPSTDAAEAVDLSPVFLTAIDDAITAYNATMGVSGQYSRLGNVLTYTHGGSDSTVTSLAIILATFEDTLVEGPEDYTLTISAPSSTTGATIALNTITPATTVTTTITDNDTATFSLSGASTVVEGAAAAYT